MGRRAPRQCPLDAPTAFYADVFANSTLMTSLHSKGPNCEFGGNPYSNTKDGQHNPDVLDEMMAHQPDGSQWVWFSGAHHTDSLQGPSYHLSKTLDATTGLRWKRFQAFLDAAPVEQNVHSDAYRDTSTSFEWDERGYIAEDEEATCGLQADYKWFMEHGNISLGIEGPDGSCSSLGPVPSNAHIVSYYQGGAVHDATGAGGLGFWNRIISGAFQGVKHDLMLSNTSAESVGGHWGPRDGPNLQAWLDGVYLQAFVASLQMTTELLSSEPCGDGCVKNAKFTNGGNGSHWPYGGGLIEYNHGYPFNNGSVFLPAVMPPAPDADGRIPKQGLTTLDERRIRVFSPAGGDEVWLLPLSWVGKSISCHVIEMKDAAAADEDAPVTITAPTVVVVGRALHLKGMPIRTPVILTVPS